MKKEYVAPVVEVEKIECSSIIAASPSNWGVEGGPIGDGNQEEDESEESMAKRFVFAENDFDFEFSL